MTINKRDKVKFAHSSTVDLLEGVVVACGDAYIAVACEQRGYIIPVGDVIGVIESNVQEPKTIVSIDTTTITCPVNKPTLWQRIKNIFK